MSPAAQQVGLEHRPLRDIVFDEMRRRIIDGTYKPGERLVEDRVAEDLGVSRNPVREALRVLEAEGFVTMVPRRGAFVTALSDEEASQVLEVHRELESLAARFAARKATQAHVAKLQRTLDSTRRAVDRSDTSRVRQLNIRFHDQILDAADNPYLREIMLTLRGRATMLVGPTTGPRGPVSLSEHVAILDAISDHDEDAAARIAAAHVGTAINAVAAWRSESSVASGSNLDEEATVD